MKDWNADDFLTARRDEMNAIEDVCVQADTLLCGVRIDREKGQIVMIAIDRSIDFETIRVYDR